MKTNPVISFDFRALFGIKTEGVLIMDIMGETGGIFDGSWHTVTLDLVEAVKGALDPFDGIDVADKGDWIIDKAVTIEISSQWFRLDNLMFRADYDRNLFNSVNIFEMGPLYAQIFEPYRYLYVADYVGIRMIVNDVEGHEQEVNRITDLMLNPANFMLVQDPNDPNDPVVRYWTDLGADPGKFGEEADPNLEDLFGRDFIVDLSLSIFADPNLRVGGALAGTIIDSGTLGWNYSVSESGTHGIQAFLLQPLPVYPYDGMPTYLPAYYAAMDAIFALGKPYYQPGLVYLLEGALWNAGVTVWPNIVAFDFTPQYFEDLIVTIKVTDGIHSDIKKFPISVVNYPVENYPPVLQLDIDDQIFYVGQQNAYIVNFIDSDCFIFSLSSVPATTHVPEFPISTNFRTDMDDLNWSITLNGISPDQYDP